MNLSAGDRDQRSKAGHHGPALNGKVNVMRKLLFSIALLALAAIGMSSASQALPASAGAGAAETLIATKQTQSNVQDVRTMRCWHNPWHWRCRAHSRYRDYGGYCAHKPWRCRGRKGRFHIGIYVH
jgi:hypothetical protein